MKTVFTQFRYLLIAALMCLVSGSVWGEETTTYTVVFSEYPAGNQYAVNEEHVINDDLTIYTTKCHFTTQLRVYDTSANNGFFYSNGLPGDIVSMSFNAGDKVGTVEVYGSSDGTIWELVNSFKTKSAYADYNVDFVGKSYNYFKVEVTGGNQIRFESLAITFKLATTSVASPTFAPEPGTYWGKQSITLAQSEGAAVYYTLDGSDPKAGTLYSAPFEISATTTVKAVAKSGDEYSNVVSAEYVIKSLTAELPYEISFKEGLGDWITITDNEDVTWSSDKTYGAKIGHATTLKVAAESWLISPEVKSDKNIILAFESSTKGDDEALKLYYATDYSLQGQTATWQEITDKATWSGGNYAWVESGDIIVNSASPIRFAFKYTSTADKSSIWEVRTLSIKEGAAQDQVETPTFTPEGGASEAEAVKVEYGTKVTVACATPEATIYGGDLEPITEPIAITQSSQKIEAYATKTDMTDSEVATAWYSAYVANPTFSISEGRVAKGVSLTITSTTADAVVTYTINDGTEQTYSAPVVLDEVKEYIIKAKATIGGMASEEVTATYTVFEPVVMNKVIAASVTAEDVTTWYAMTQTLNKAGFSGEIVQVAEDKAKATDALVWIIECDNEGGTATIKNQDGKYVAFTEGSSTDLKLEDTPCNWFMIKAAEGTYRFQREKEGTARVLAYRSGTNNNIFKAYSTASTTGYYFDLYLLEAVENLPSSIDTNNTVKGIQAYSFDGTLVINAGEAQNIRIYSLDGRMVRDLQLNEGENTVNGLAKGVYLMNNQKVVVK